MRILISGIGVAGPTLAYWLKRHGFEPTLLEKAPRLRTGGYIVDFWGAGFDIAERMQILPAVRERGYRVKEVRVVNGEGRNVSGFSVDVFNRIAKNRYVSVGRSVLAELLYGSLDGKVETIFGDNLVGLQQSADSVRVEFESGKTREFDLVIGADGLHSRVRELAFGPQEKFEKYLGYKIAAFDARGYRPREELVYMMFTQVGQQISRFTMRDDKTMFLFIAADPDPHTPHDLAAQKAYLRARFAGKGWESDHILEALDGCSELYFDRVSQIRMPAEEGLWSRGRVSLVGDAASCVSLLAGQGTALAMTAAYILAGELKRAGGDYKVAFERYQKLFGPFVAAKQVAAIKLAGAFAPRSNFGLFFGHQVMKLMRISWVADLAVGRALVDRLELPEY